MVIDFPSLLSAVCCGSVGWLVVREKKRQWCTCCENPGHKVRESGKERTRESRIINVRTLRRRKIGMKVFLGATISRMCHSIPQFLKVPLAPNEPNSGMRSRLAIQSRYFYRAAWMTGVLFECSCCSVRFHPQLCSEWVEVESTFRDLLLCKDKLPFWWWVCVKPTTPLPGDE